MPAQCTKLLQHDWVDLQCFVLLLDGVVVIALVVIGVPEHGVVKRRERIKLHSFATLSDSFLNSAHLHVEPACHLVGVGRTGIKCQTFLNLRFGFGEVPEKEHINRCQ